MRPETGIASDALMHLETTTARLRDFELSAAQFLRLALVSVAALWLIVLTGAAVRLTDSGLGCRHWPGCEKGHPLPAKDYHAYIEFGNRVIGGVTIVVVLLAALAARRTPELSRGSRRLALAVFAGALAHATVLNPDLRRQKSTSVHSSRDACRWHAARFLRRLRHVPLQGGCCIKPS